MMFGLRDQFLYGECESCHSLQLLDLPTDMSRYYPPGYYSFAPCPTENLIVKSPSSSVWVTPHQRGQHGYDAPG